MLKKISTVINDEIMLVCHTADFISLLLVDYIPISFLLVEYIPSCIKKTPNADTCKRM